MELKEAIITPKGEVRCPYCGKLGLVLTGEETVKKLKIRCRGGRKGMEHYFLLNVLPDSMGKEAV